MTSCLTKTEHGTIFRGVTLAFGRLHVMPQFSRVACPPMCRLLGVTLSG